MLDNNLSLLKLQVIFDWFQDRNYTTVALEIIVRGHFDSVSLSVAFEDTEGNVKVPRTYGESLEDIVSAFYAVSSQIKRLKKLKEFFFT